MKFGLLSQIQVPKPWTETTERQTYWDNLDQAVLRKPPASASKNSIKLAWLCAKA